jgi:hypothetical protein
MSADEPLTSEQHVQQADYYLQLAEAFWAKETTGRLQTSDKMPLITATVGMSQAHALLALAKRDEANQ